MQIPRFVTKIQYLEGRSADGRQVVSQLYIPLEAGMAQPDS